VTSSAVALVGASHTPPRAGVEDRSYEEMIFDAATAALADAGLAITDIDSVVLSTSDQVHGRVIESMVTTGAAGGVGRDVTTLASGGDHAFIYACLRLKAGQARRVLVAVASKESEGRNPSHADWLSAEPFLMRPLGISSVAAAGLQASAYAAQFGLDAERVAEVGRRRRAAWAQVHDPIDVDDPSRPAAWPLTRGDLPAPCDVACAAVLVAPDAVQPGQTPAWIDGIGWAEDRYQLGERDLTRFASLETAALMALGQGRTALDVDVVEVQEISTVASFAALESLGLAARGEGASRAEDDSPAVNPSGGNLPGNPGNAAGFLRLVAAAQQVRGRAGAAQVVPRPARAIGAAMHGFAGQGASVVVFAATEGAEVT
jgi:hypothetical protein